MIRLRTRLCYTLAHRLPAPFHPFHLHLSSARSSRASLTLPTACSSFRTHWAIRLLANGGWCASLSPTALLCPHHACRTGNSLWNSIPFTTPTFGSTHPTSDIGCNTTPSATSPLHPRPHKHISFGLPIPLKRMLLVIDWCPFVRGLISSIVAPSCTGPSNLQVSMAAKRATVYPLLTGMPLLNSHRSTRIPFLGSIYLHTLSTSIVVFTPHFVIKPMQMHYAPLHIAATIVFIPDDKRLSGDNAIVSPFF